MAALKEQIASLEAENVGKKDWVLMGEATSKSRPQNSLLEEDLEFERTMKAVPVVTEDKILELEDRIKARILEGRFDDVVRLRPISDKPFLPSRLFELQDTKSSQSLAQIYENDYVATQNGGSADDRDGKLKKEHEELEKQWDGICSKLDALCNAHFVPKQVGYIALISITVLTDLATSHSQKPLFQPLQTSQPPPSSPPYQRQNLLPHCWPRRKCSHQPRAIFALKARWPQLKNAPHATRNASQEKRPGICWTRVWISTRR